MGSLTPITDVDRKLTQRVDALGRGDSIRLQRVGLKRRIKSQGREGAATAARVLLGNPDIIHTLDVGDFLMWVSFFGKKEAKKLLAHHRINPWCELDELSGRQRRALASDLMAFASGESRQALRPMPKEVS